MRNLKNYVKSLCCISACLLFLLSCSEYVSTAFHEKIHGVWAKKGTAEKLKTSFVQKNYILLGNDTIRDLLVDVLYNPIGTDSIKQYVETWMVALGGDPSLPPSTLTEYERDSTSSIWIIEECERDDQIRFNPVLMRYRGNGIFVSDSVVSNGLYRFFEVTDTESEYGTCDSNGNRNKTYPIEMLFKGQKWFFDRDSSSWYSNVISDYTDDYYHQTAFSDLKEIKLYKKRTNDSDFLICSFSHEMLKYQEGIYIRGYNTLASVDILSDNIIYPEHMFETNDWMFDKNVRSDFILDWHNDTAFLKNYYLKGTFYLKFCK